VAFSNASTVLFVIQQKANNNLDQYLPLKGISFHSMAGEVSSPLPNKGGGFFCLFCEAEEGDKEKGRTEKMIKLF